jgi:hypothetical protein
MYFIYLPLNVQYNFFSVRVQGSYSATHVFRVLCVLCVCWVLCVLHVLWSVWLCNIKK